MYFLVLFYLFESRMTSYIFRHIPTLGLFWQIIRIHLLTNVSIKNRSEMAVLLFPQESLQTFARLSPEQLLLRWFNHQLREAGSNVATVNNFGNDLKVLNSAVDFNFILFIFIR